ncbi:MAG: 5-methyltetrahydropteroyltriglutamate--homocysteine S-methyltransferase [Actinomycetota bacterium]|nr:5-methyltetrahydropteroyltriglutamate--homocysteine S-methyltransferase [Actinomycetota bacterium]
MRTAVHGMARIGRHRELKWALEDYWAGRSTADVLLEVAAGIRRDNWRTLAAAGVNFVPSNDFSLYDHVLDAVVALGAVPARFGPPGAHGGLASYFAMARGGEVAGVAVAPLELTKWFDTNYHQLVPELGPDAAFSPDPSKALGELEEANALGVETMPVLLGPLTFVLRSAPAIPGFSPLTVLDWLVGAYLELLGMLAAAGARWVRLDEPALAEDRSRGELEALVRAYRRLGDASGRPSLAISTYFGHVGAAMATLADLPVEGIGLDLCRGPENLALLEETRGIGERVLFAGVVDGRNVWVNDFDASLGLLERVGAYAAEVVASTSCSLLHVPVSLSAETTLDPEVRPWLAFAEEKVAELAVLAEGAEHGPGAIADDLEVNRAVRATRRTCERVHDPSVRRATAEAPTDPRRRGSPAERAAAQAARLALPPLPTTTIGSFPQTAALRAVRASRRAGKTSEAGYRRALEAEIDRVVDLQEELGLDVLVHGEPERDDMVRYFAASLGGFVLPESGWVQSYGSRCVRPPILFGDVSRPEPLTVTWTRYAAARTTRPMKAMLTGPVTMLSWSFVRDDLSRADVAAQLGLALAEEVADLQCAGTAVVQIDEPALREGLPLRRAERAGYLAWATRAFRLASSAAVSATQVHTHMCYAELADVVDVLADLGVDVASFEAARSAMTLLSALGDATYRGGVGPGVYDVHSPQVPAADEISSLLRRAVESVGPERLWVNPDCGLKTRSYAEVTEALANMVAAAREVRAELAAEARQGGHARGSPGDTGVP